MFKIGQILKQIDTGEIFECDNLFIIMMNIYHEEYNFELIKDI